MKLPDLHRYRSDFKIRGVSYPLLTIPPAADGLLNTLPEPTKEKQGWPWTKETNPNIYSVNVSWPKLTIVTPSYNQASFIEETIRSILLQNYPNLEYIVIDGASTDGTKTMLEKYSPWISYWQSEKDGGQSNAINLGFSLASGDYYAWINSDDYYLPDAFYKVATRFLTTKASFIYGYAYNKTGEKLDLVSVPPLIDYFIKIPSLLQPSCFWSSAINKPVWEEMQCSLDYELWLRLVKGNKRSRIRQPLAVAHVHDDAKTFDPKMKAKWDEDHVKMWADNAHGTVYEWKRLVFLNRIRLKIFKLLNII